MFAWLILAGKSFLVTSRIYPQVDVIWQIKLIPAHLAKYEIPCKPAGWTLWNAASKHLHINSKSSLSHQSYKNIFHDYPVYGGLRYLCRGRMTRVQTKYKSRPASAVIIDERVSLLYSVNVLFFMMYRGLKYCLSLKTGIWTECILFLHIFWMASYVSDCAHC